MRKIILFAFALTLNVIVSIGQTKIEQDSIRNIIESNFKKIDSFKTKLDKVTVENYLIGTWKFVNLQTTDGKILDSLKIQFYDSQGNLHSFKPEKAKRSDIKFSSDKRYVIFENPQNETSNGHWIYEFKNKRILLTYDKPYIPNDIKKLGIQIPGIPSDNLYIFKITKTELYLLELYPISEYEQWFHLRYYKK